MMNAKTLEAIKRHGESLLAAFPNAIEKDPVALCKKLRRIETSLHKPLVDYCNGDFQDDEEGSKMDAICNRAIERAAKLLGLDKGGVYMAGLFVNRDPRGYALKLRSRDESSWFKDWQDECYRLGRTPIYQDWGGYGILAPDLTVDIRKAVAS